MTDTTDTTVDNPNAPLSIQDVANRLGIGRNSAYKAVADGTIPSVRVGRRILVPRAAFDKMLDPPIPESMLPRVPTGPLPTPGPPRSWRRFTELEDAIITKDYLDYVPTEEIAAKLGRSHGTLRQRIFHLKLRRSNIVSKLLPFAPEHLRACVASMDPDEWTAAAYAWRDQALQDAKLAHSAEAERVHAEQLQQAAEIDQRTDLSRNDKMKAKRMLGLTLEEIGVMYGITRERVRQLTDPTFAPSIPCISPIERLERLEARSARERDRIMTDAAERLFKLWQITPPGAQAKFLTMIDDKGDASDDPTI